MYDKGRLTKQELECLEMFRLFDAGAHDLAMLKTNVKKWEYKLYGGRPEVYPQDRKAILTLLQFKQERIEREQKRMNKEQEMEQKRREVLGRR